MRIFILRFLQNFFDALYHQLAWTYDRVAWLVSVGKWNDWVLSVLPYLGPGMVLELGFGPGHLQLAGSGSGLSMVGLDESNQMAKMAYRKLGSGSRLARGIGQNIPFASASCDYVVATFPAPYIIERRTISEIERVLRPGGRVVILPGAVITGKGLFDRLAALLFKIALQSATGMEKQIVIWESAYANAGFSVQLEKIRRASSDIYLIMARKPG